jgi:hypothetical protein
MTPILLLILISALIGLMDKVKFHWDETWFSTVTRPVWARYLNPHEYIWIPTNTILFYLAKGPLIIFLDFWHSLKWIMLQAVFMLAYPLQGAKWYIWLLVCNALYFTMFNVVYSGMFNKK